MYRTIQTRNISTPHKLCSLVLSALLMTLIASPSSGSQLYRYKDDQGNYVLNQTIPPKYVSKGYEILNSQGRVVQRVAPALTPEQIAARDAALEQERLRKIEKEKQDAIDAELKQLYSHPNDAVRVLERRINDIKGLILVKKGQIQGTKNRILEEESKAAARQRKGLNIDESTLEQLKKFRSDINNNEQDIAELMVELEKVKEDFHVKIMRLEKITGYKAKGYPLEEKSASAKPSTAAESEAQ